VTRFIFTRVLAGVATLALASILIFGATEILPGDPATAALGRDATPGAVAALREELGLNRPAIVRYGDWLSGVVRFDFGTSVANHVPVSKLIDRRLKNTGILMLVTMILLVPLSLLLGTVSGLRHGSRLDATIQVATLSTVALPEFVVGITLILVFAIGWSVLPAVSLTASATNLVLPVATLLLLSVAYTARMVRAGVIDALRSEHVTMARLKGMPENLVIRRHVLPNALGPACHAFALTLAWLAGGIVIVETLFAYPGIGDGLVQAVAARDYPTVEAICLVLAAVYVFANLAADVFTIMFTPRLRTEL
jgi:peptide/nickel transport system permease protein